MIGAGNHRGLAECPGLWAARITVDVDNSGRAARAACLQLRRVILALPERLGYRGPAHAARGAGTPAHASGAPGRYRTGLIRAVSPVFGGYPGRGVVRRVADAVRAR